MPPLGLYIHVPFCSAICGYCNFNRGLFDAALETRYVRALEREIAVVGESVAHGRHPVTGLPLSVRSTRERPAAADTIYFGGGTPSLLSAAKIRSLVHAARIAFDVDEHAEVTLEANPETVTREGMAAYREAGITRVSIGVQSFRDAELRRLGRVHSAAGAVGAFAAARAAGIANVSLDLMLWLPQQTVDDCLFSVRELARLRPEHASLYLLELYPHAPLKEEMARSGWSMAPDEDAATMYLRAIDLLRAAGYEHYEISNVAQPGRRSRHNLKYWSDGEWLAFGSGAHSTLDGLRWKNVSATDAYVEAIQAGAGRVVSERRVLGPVERFQEAVFMGLRLVEGIDLDAIERRYGIDVWERFGRRLAPFVEAGLLVREPATRGEPASGRGRLRLSPDGLLLSNEVMAVFIDEAGTVK
jgi:oxygen-independent coproporphyrinogen-3 oxidase